MTRVPWVLYSLTNGVCVREPQAVAAAAEALRVDRPSLKGATHIIRSCCVSRGNRTHIGPNPSRRRWSSGRRVQPLLLRLDLLLEFGSTISSRLIGFVIEVHGGLLRLRHSIQNLFLRSNVFADLAKLFAEVREDIDRRTVLSRIGDGIGSR